MTSRADQNNEFAGYASPGGWNGKIFPILSWPVKYMIATFSSRHLVPFLVSNFSSLQSIVFYGADPYMLEVGNNHMTPKEYGSHFNI